MDRLKQLEAYSTRELIDELMRRKGELDSGMAILAESNRRGVKYSRKSAAKAAYWKDWHDYKGAHPAATLKQWRRSRA